MDRAHTNWDDWGGDVLSVEAVAARKPKPPAEIAADAGLVVETVEGFVGAILGVEAGHVRLEDRRGKIRLFPLGGGFLIDGAAVVLVKPTAVASLPTRSASGSRAVEGHRARVALPSRILVEGKHDAELVEKVWGHDLRVEGVAVELLEGVDDLAAVVRSFAPAGDRRLGILVDHLVPGSKESRIAADVMRSNDERFVRIVGHPFIDVWQAVKPARLGLERWPEVPRTEEWKRGTLRRLGLPHESQADVAAGWQRILGRVRDWNDIEPRLLAPVEELIDFVTTD